ncbi:transient receptor potential cation channel protein painless-like [Culicoides brevitarsis]|uniref:transient receptor potential cation channel protein painless-like n=1 Tax=Culicoides brevitarsis TaxID=469753 RepID=UPI00307CB72A
MFPRSPDVSLEMSQTNSDLPFQLNAEHLHTRIQNLRNVPREKLPEQIEWISFETITLTTNQIDMSDKFGKCALHYLLEFFLDFKYEDHREGDLVELIMIKSRIDYSRYQDGIVLELLKKYNVIKFYQWQLLNNKENAFLQETLEGPQKDLILRNRDNLDDLLQMVFVVGALRTLKVLVDLIKNFYGARYPILPTAVEWSVLVKDNCKSKFYRCFDYLLSRADIDINEPDKNGETAFFIACRLNDSYMVNELLKRKPFIAAKNPQGSYAIVDLQLETLSNIFDACIISKPDHLIQDERAFKIIKTFSLKVLNLDNLIFMDLRNFYPVKNEEDRNFNVLELIQCIGSTKDLRLMLNHPVIGTIIDLKWRKLRYYVLLRILGALIPIILAFFLRDFRMSAAELTFFMVCLGFLILFEFISTILTILTDHGSFYLGTMNICMYFTLFMFFATSTCQAVCPSVVGIVWIFTGICVNGIISVFNKNVAHYTIMLMYVAYNIMKFLVFNSFLLLGLIMSYASIFYDPSMATEEEYAESDGNETADSFGEVQEQQQVENNYSFNVKLTLFKTLVMLVGEIWDNVDGTRSFRVYLVYAFLIFMLPIVALNLLNGLAVGNVKDISSQAQYWHRKVQAMVLYEVETMLRKIESFARIPWPDVNFTARLIRERHFVAINTTNGLVYSIETLTRHKKVGKLNKDIIQPSIKVIKRRERSQKQKEISAIRKGSTSFCPHCFEQLA